jgi:hypothetical protein
MRWLGQIVQAVILILLVGGFMADIAIPLRRQEMESAAK